MPSIHAFAVLALSLAAGVAAEAGVSSPALPEPAALAVLGEAATDPAAAAALLDAAAPRGGILDVDLSGGGIQAGRRKSSRAGILPGEPRPRPKTPRVPGVRTLRERTGKHGAFKTFGAGFLAFAMYPPFFAAGAWIMGYATTGIPGGVIASILGLAAGVVVGLAALGVGLVKGFSKLFAGRF